MNAMKQADPRRETARPEPTYIAPEVDIRETKDEYLLEADMPGVGKEGVDILLEGNELTIVGRRSESQRNGDVLYREGNSHDYRRTFVLDPMVDASKIKCTMDQGVLCVHLPKAEKVKPKRISVTD